MVARLIEDTKAHSRRESSAPEDSTAMKHPVGEAEHVLVLQQTVGNQQVLRLLGQTALSRVQESEPAGLNSTLGQSLDFSTSPLLAMQGPRALAAITADRQRYFRGGSAARNERGEGQTAAPISQEVLAREGVAGTTGPTQPEEALRLAFSGPGTQVPHMKELGSRMAYDFSSVGAYFGSSDERACDDLGAEAFSVGDKIAFKGSEAETEANRIADSVVQTTGPGPGIERLRPAFGRDLSHVRLHTDEPAAEEAVARGARAFTTGNDIFFSRGALQPETRWGMHLLAHEIAHTFQQADGKVPAGTAQNEDWDFTPADYDTLMKTKEGDLRFGDDSAWFPKALQDNLKTTLKFVLTAKNPPRTAGVNVTDFYHGHFVIPKHKGKLPTVVIERGDFIRKQEKLEFEALEPGKKYKGGFTAEDVTTKTLPKYTEIMPDIEKAATPVLEEAIKVPNAAVIYHTYEHNKPTGMKSSDPTRNIITPISATPKDYIYPNLGTSGGCPNTAEAYLCEYETILDFAFLVDRIGVVHVRPSDKPRILSTVTGFPIKNP
jgi:hypothetical protein